MPELPDVEAFKNYFDRHVSGKKIEQVEVIEKTLLRGVTERHFRTVLADATLKKSKRYGKWLIVETSKGKAMAIHFGMTGNLVHSASEKQRPPYSRIEFDLKGKEKLFYTDRRKIGGLELVDSTEDLIRKHKLGPDAFQIPREDFLERISKKRGKIKPVLMDQSILAGIGNIYADEILFQSGVHPKTSIYHLSEKELEKIFSKMKPVLETAIKYQGKRKSIPDHFLLPHRKKGETCPVCGGKIEEIKVGGRTTYFCPSCQKAK